MSIQTLKIDLATYKKELEQAQDKSNNFEYEISNSEWDNILDDAESNVFVSGIEFSPSYVLKNCDPTAYRCGKSDYEASFDLDACGEYQELQNTISDLETEIKDLEYKIHDLEMGAE